MPVSAEIAHSLGHHAPGPSWTAAGLGKQDLLYVTNSNGLVNIYRYRRRSLAGVLTGLQSPTGECVDRAQNVYVVDFLAESAVEYAHGGKKPIAAVSDSPYNPYGCSIDTKTGDLAIANYSEGYLAVTRDFADGNLAVYRHARGSPVLYGNRFDHFVSCAYDDRGDLLAASLNGYSGEYQAEFDYLPRHSTKLLSIDLPGSYDSVQAVAWDGKYWVVLSDNELYRYVINLTGQHIDTIGLAGGYGYVRQIWIYRTSPKELGTQVVGGFSDDDYSNNAVGYWKYPAGSELIHEITKDLDGPYGVAISLGT